MKSSGSHRTGATARKGKIAAVHTTNVETGYWPVIGDRLAIHRRIGWKMRSLVVFLLCIQHVGALIDVPATPTRVVVTGAAGRTGRLVFAKLQEDPRFSPVAVVRTEKSGRKLMKEMNCDLDQVVVCDVTELKTTDPSPIPAPFPQAMIICTSAVPTISARSLLQAILKIPWNLVRCKKAVDFRSLRFKFKRHQYPEMVDYNGQIAQIDLAKKLGMNHVVIVSSMGGTDPDNFLNKVGKKRDGSGNGDILLWKRKAERYLVESGLRYTIIHPGGLIDTPAGEEELVLDVDDKLIDSKKRSISRADVANLCVAALTVGKEQSISFDCITRPVEEGQPVSSAEDALSAFLKLGRTANYAL